MLSAMATKSINCYSLVFPLLLILSFLYLSIFYSHVTALYSSFFNSHVTLYQPPASPPSIPPELSQSPAPAYSPSIPPEFSQPPAPSPVAGDISTSKKKGKSTSWERVERDLALARVAIRDAVKNKNYKTSFSALSFIPSGPIYRNPFAFYQSHVEMVNRFKIWVYREGERPIMHEGPLNNIYGIEGQFMEEMENGLGLSRLRARSPAQAHAFFLPWSVAFMVHYLYRPLVSYSRAPINHVVLDYVRLVSQRYPFWNRTLGADHFMLSCHDWGPDVYDADPKLFKNFMRGLCNANTSEGFRPNQDFSIPEVNIPVGKLGPPDSGVRISKRRTLAFFAGGAHGHVRSFLFQHWKEKDPEIRVYEKLPKKLNYFKLLGDSKFCLCPSGYEVASPRVVEAIHAECVPVLISDNYSLPFSDVLDWSKFSVQIPVADIPEIKTRLMAISTRKYLRLVKGVRSVKWHFTLNRPSKPFDLIHMMLHSVWLRRLNANIT